MARLRDQPSDTNFILLQGMGADYVKAASALMETWDISLQKKHLMPILQLLGHSLELTLKGLLSIQTLAFGTGIPNTHDIVELAKDPNLASLILLSSEEMVALEALGSAYASPFLVRYPQLGLHQLPDAGGFEILRALAQRLSTQLDGLARQQDPNDPAVRRRLGAI